MEVSGVGFRQLQSFGGNGIDTRCLNFDSGKVGVVGSGNCRVFSKPRNFSRVLRSGFCDNGHLEYYYASTRCGEKQGKEKTRHKGVTSKKKLKLLKDLSKDLSMYSELGFGLDSGKGLVDEDQGKLISDAAEVLLKQFEQIRAEDKELRRRKKQEKADMKAIPMKTMVDSESSSASSSSECDEVIDIRRFRSEEAALVQQQQQSSNEIQAVTHEREVKCSTTTTNTSCSNSSGDHNDGSGSDGLAKRVEVCMGNKCKKLGSGALMEEFERVLGIEGVVFGCKCMGKCREGPNVRVLNSLDGVQSEVVDDSVRTSANPLFIGVGLEDVGTIVTNLFNEGDTGDLGLMPALKADH